MLRILFLFQIILLCVLIHTISLALPPGFENQHTLKRRLNFCLELLLYPFTHVTPVVTPELPDDQSWDELEKWRIKLSNCHNIDPEFAALYAEAFQTLLPEFAQRNDLLFHILSEHLENYHPTELHIIFDLFGTKLPAFPLPKTYLALLLQRENDFYGQSFLQSLNEEKNDFEWEQAAALSLLEQDRSEEAFLRLQKIPYKEHLEEFHIARIQKNLAQGRLSGLSARISTMKHKFPHIDTFTLQIQLLFHQLQLSELIELAQQKKFTDLEPLCQEYLVLGLCFNQELKQAFSFAETASPPIELPLFPTEEEERPNFYRALCAFLPKHLQYQIITHPKTKKLFLLPK